jgi:DHA3 family macrolide efflux protein-like MFS transporter
MGGQTLSLFGSMLVQYAITWHITMTTQSGAMMTISIIFGILPTFFISPFGGVWADRYDRKKLIILADSAIALTTLALAVAFMTGHGSLWLLFTASAIRGIGTGNQTPAVGALLPQIVPQDHLMKANATFGSIQSVIMLSAPMAAGALMSLASIEALFFVDVVTAVIAITLLLVFLRVPPHARAMEKLTTGYWKDLRDGFSYVASHAYLKRFFLFWAFFYILAAPVAVLTPLQVTRSFGNDVWRLTAIEITFSVGMTLGGILIAAWGGFHNRVYTMAAGTFIIGAATMGLGLVPWFWVYLAVMAICGISLPMFNTPATVLLQETVEPAYLGRSFGVLGMISSLAWPAGMIIFGPLADTVPIEWLLIGTGSGIFAMGLSLLASKTLVRAGSARAASITATTPEQIAASATASITAEPSGYRDK